MAVERRLKWTCYPVLHDGEGPLGKPCTVEGVNLITAEEAAIMAAEDIRFEDGACLAQLHWWVAVDTDCQDEPSNSLLVFKVRQEVVRRLVTGPPRVELRNWLTSQNGTCGGNR